MTSAPEEAIGGASYPIFPRPTWISRAMDVLVHKDVDGIWLVELRPGLFYPLQGDLIHDTYVGAPQNRRRPERP